MGDGIRNDVRVSSQSAAVGSGEPVLLAKIANPFVQGSTPDGDDHVAYFDDGFAQFVYKDVVLAVHVDGAVFAPDASGGWARVRPSEEIATAAKTILDKAPTSFKALARTSEAVATKTTTAATAADPVDAMSTDELRSAVKALRADVNELKTQQKATTEVREAEEARAAEEARKPSFMRALMEILETIGRIFNPVISLISLCVRTIRLLPTLAEGLGGNRTDEEKAEWRGRLKHEMIRWAGDAIGSLGMVFPAAAPITGIVSAAVYEGSNLSAGGFKTIRGGESEFLGGIEQLFGKAKVRNPLREGAAVAWEGASKLGKSFGSVVYNPAVAEGSKQDDGTKPLNPAKLVEVKVQ